MPSNPFLPVKGQIFDQLSNAPRREVVDTMQSVLAELSDEQMTKVSERIAEQAEQRRIRHEQQRANLQKQAEQDAKEAGIAALCVGGVMAVILGIVGVTEFVSNRRNKKATPKPA